MSLIGLLASTEKMVPEGRLHMRPFQFHLKEHWRYPQSLDNLLPWTEAIAAHLDWWQNPSNVMKGADLHPKDHSIQLFTGASNKGWGAHLDQSSTKGLWPDREKRLHINVLELKAVSLALRIQGPVPEPNSASCNGQLNSGSLHKQGGTHSAEMCALLWKIMTWFHHYHITLKARHVPGCVNVIAGLLSRSNQVQSTEWSLHPQVFKQICQKWFTPHVDLFATHLNHKLPLSVSPVPDPKAWDIDALDRSHCLCLPSDRSPSQGDPKNQAMLLPDHRSSPRLARDALVLGPSAALNRYPTATSGVNDSSQQSHNYVFHSNPQHLNLHAWCLRVDSSKNKASLWRWQRELLHLRGHQQEPSTSQSGPYLRNGAEKIWWTSPLPSVKQVSDFFMYLYQDLNRRPSTIDGYRTAIVDTLGPNGPPYCTKFRLLSSFHRDRPKSSRNLPKWNLSVVLNELTKASFEPMKNTDLKHLTLKTAFLLALASGKRRNEIHA